MLHSKCYLGVQLEILPPAKHRSDRLIAVVLPKPKARRRVPRFVAREWEEEVVEW